MTRDAIIGCAAGYEWSDLWPFVCSARKNAPASQVILLVGEGSAGVRTSRATIEILEDRGVWVVPCSLATGQPPFLDPWAKDAELLRPFGLGRMRLVISRFAAIYAFLRTQWHLLEGGRVLLTDTRDVLTTGDIWSWTWPEDRVSLFREWSGMNIGRCPYNSAAIRTAYGAEVAEWMSNRPILCSGSILGPVGLVQGLLEAMLKEFARINCMAAGILDQAVLNVLAARWAVPVREWDNTESPVLNVGYMPGGTPDVTAPPVAMIHQADRPWHAELLAKLLAEI